MALPRGMFRRGGKLWARKDVPKPLQKIVGKTSLQESLRTADVNAARPLFHGVMQRFESEIAAARKALAEQKPMPFQPFTFKLDLPPDQLEAMYLAEAAKPHNQMKAAADRIERQLVQAGLVASTPDPVTLDDLFDRWVRERKPSFGSQMEFRRAKDAFKKLNGDLPIAEYTSAHARAWKDRVVEMTAPNGKPLAHATRIKWFTSVKTLFKLADSNDLLSVKPPFEKIVLERPKRAKVNKRQEWDDDDLQTLFGSPVYLERARPRAGCGEAAYWLPVLGLYHGCRLGELCQLDTADVVKKNGILCLKIRPSDEDDDDAKSVKTSESIRTVPIHKAVLKLGFEAYLATIKGKKLFPLIKPDSVGRWSGTWSKWFGRYRRELGLNDRWTDYHSLRHGWKSAARSADLSEEYHDEISGHDSGNASVGRSYGHIPIAKLKAALDRVQFNITIPKWTA